MAQHNRRHGLPRSLLLTALMLLFAAPTMAQGPGWTANATIVKLAVTGDGGVNVRLSPDLTGCTPNAGYAPTYASVYPTHPGIDRIKAALLSAYATGSVVSLYLSDSTCRVGEIQLGGW